MYFRTLVSGKTDVADLAGLLRLEERLGVTAFSEMLLRLAVESNAVDLPEVEMIGLEPLQRFVEHLQREFLVAPVRTDLGHQEHFVAASLERASEPVLAPAFPVLPAVVEEGDAAIDGSMREPVRLGVALRVAEMVPAHAECADLFVAAAQLSLWDGAGHRAQRASSCGKLPYEPTRICLAVGGPIELCTNHSPTNGGPQRPHTGSHLLFGPLRQSIFQ